MVSYQCENMLCITSGGKVIRIVSTGYKLQVTVAACTCDMKQSCVLIFTIFWGLQIWGVRGGNKLIDLAFKAVEQNIGNGVFDLSDANYMSIINFAMSTSGNSQGLEVGSQHSEKDAASRFFYSGIDWTLNLLPTIILIKLAFIGGLLDWVTMIVL